MRKPKKPKMKLSICWDAKRKTLFKRAEKQAREWKKFSGQSSAKFLLQRVRLTGPLRALIFDSKYDTYKGVLAYVRIIDGTVRAEEMIATIATRPESSVIEVGYFRSRIQKMAICSGEIGYIATGFKSVDECRVGDTYLVSLIRKTM